MRDKSVVKNSYIAFLTQVSTMVIAFVMQSIFVRSLGGAYVGANGLFTNILSILSFSELGIGNAAAFALYDPLKNGNQERISGILSFLRRAYTFVGLTVFLVGVLLAPFLHLFVHGDSIRHLKFYFVLFVINSAISYFFSYKRTLLIADQKNYITTLNVFYAKVATSIIQVAFLLMHSYLGFLIIQIVGTLISNFLISRKTNSLYRDIFPLKSSLMDPNDKKVLLSSSLGIMGQQIGGIIVRDTNNLFISGFVGLMATGIYSGYMLIVNGVMTILTQVINSTVATLGSWNISMSSSQMTDILKKHLFVTWTFSYFVVSILISSITPFINIWLGPAYNFDFVIVLVILFNLYFSLNRLTLLAFVQAQGLFVKTGIKSLVEAALNIIVSLLLIVVFRLGVLGVVLGTTIVNLSLNIWFDPWVVYVSGLGGHLDFKYFQIYVVRAILTFVPATIVEMFMRSVAGQFNVGLYLAVSVLLTVFVATAIYLIYVVRDPEFKYLIGLIKQRFNKE